MIGMRESDSPPQEPYPGDEWIERPLVHHTRACIIMALPTLVVLVLLGLAARMWSRYLQDNEREEFREDVRGVEPLLGALDTFREEHRVCPADLAELVSDYVARVPAPPLDLPVGEWRYTADREKGRRRAREERPDNTALDLPAQVYALSGSGCPEITFPSPGSSPTPSSTPHEECARFGCGGVLERIDGWAYYHE